MNKRNDPKSQLARLPDGQKVRIESREGHSVLVRRIDGPRRGTLAVCPIDKLRPI
jgi:hypothetical protein